MTEENQEAFDTSNLSSVLPLFDPLESSSMWRSAGYTSGEAASQSSDAHRLQQQIETLRQEAEINRRAFNTQLAAMRETFSTQLEDIANQISAAKRSASEEIESIRQSHRTQLSTVQERCSAQEHEIIRLRNIINERADANVASALEIRDDMHQVESSIHAELVALRVDVRSLIDVQETELEAERHQIEEVFDAIPGLEAATGADAGLPVAAAEQGAAQQQNWLHSAEQVVVRGITMIFDGARYILASGMNMLAEIVNGTIRILANNSERIAQFASAVTGYFRAHPEQLSMLVQWLQRVFARRLALTAMIAQ